MHCFGVTRYLQSLWPPPAGVETDMTAQVEYLVVLWTEDDQRVLLSLRQADILKALANDTELTSGGGGVPDLQATTGARYVTTPTRQALVPRSHMLTCRQSRISTPCLPPRVWQIHARGNTRSALGDRI